MGASVGWLYMTYKHINVRSGLTAIAAVLAFSSTPLVAQETTTPPDTVTEPAPTADPLAPDPAAPETTATEPPASEATPAAKTTPAKRSAAAPKRTAATNRASSQPARSAVPAAPTPTSEATAEAAPLPPPLPEPVAAPPVSEPAATAEAASTSNDLMADESLPIAGAAGLGLLALGGIGLAVQRRRRRKDELEHQAANQKYLDEHPEVPDEPTFDRAGLPPAAIAEAEVMDDAPRTELPEGFDLSRFGPHVRAAYLGPTPDNPSLSLRHRLRRAGAMDQRARLEAEKAPEGERPTESAATAQNAMWNADSTGFMFRKSGTKPPARPAYQH